MTDREGGTTESEIPNLMRSECRIGFQSISHNFPGELAGHGPHSRIIIVEIRDARFDKTGQKLGLRFRNAFDRIEKLEMHRIDVGDNAFVGFGDRGQGTNLSLCRHPHFENSHRLRMLNTEQAKRQAEFIIEVSRRTQHLESPAENGGNHLLRCRLAGTPGYAYDGPAPLPSYETSEILQSFECGFDSHHLEFRGTTDSGVFYNGSGRLFLDRLLDEIVAVETRSFYCEKQVSGIQGSRVDRVTSNLGISAAD